MKVQELLMNIKIKTFNMERELRVKKYLPIQEKQNVAKLIVSECTEEVDGVVKLNSMKQYLSYVKYMITMHTNLEYTEEDYDVLCSTEYEGTTLLNMILSYFGPDAEECSRILNLMLDDYMRENSIECTVGRFLNNFNNTIGAFTTTLSNINLSDVLPEGIDTARFNTFLEQYIK